MERTEIDGKVSNIVFDRSYTYVYFRKDGSLYKIYAPKNTEKKFIKVQNYIQGIDQLVGKPILVITSSLKDLMSFTRLNIKNIECIAPDSENSMISESMIEKIKKKYQHVIVLFDNDDPGINAAKKYKEKYGFNYIVFPVEKDLSDAVKAIGVDAVKERLLPYLKEALA
jgi:5S rRNA maturation endonuclease (ribonuclease M5)